MGGVLDHRMVPADEAQKAIRFYSDFFDLTDADIIGLFTIVRASAIAHALPNPSRRPRPWRSEDVVMP